MIAIIAVLASLLLTALSSAKKKGQAAVCTSNLHQFAIALNVYLDDYNGLHPTLDGLARNSYLRSPDVLICPADFTKNWGGILESNSYPTVLQTTNTPQRSYLTDPLVWSDAEWEILRNAGNRAGIAACQLHGLGKQSNPDIRNYSGLLLRAQLDGSTIRRQFFWGDLAGPPLPPYTTNAYYALQVFFDDRENWKVFH